MADKSAKASNPASSIASYTQGIVQSVLGAEEEDYDPHKHRNVPNPTTYGETFVHLMKGCIGAGLLAMPDAIGRMGIIIGPIFVVFLGIFATYCIEILIYAEYKVCKRKRIGYLSFPDAMKMSLQDGPPALRFSAPIFYYGVDVMLVFWQIGVCCLYCVFVGESFVQVCQLYGTVTTVRTIVYIQFPILLVINMIRDLKLLTPFSSVSNVLTIIGVLLVFFYLVEDDVVIDSSKLLMKDIINVPIFVGIVLFAMEAVGVVLALEYNMENPKEFVGVFGLFAIAMALLVIIFTTMGVFGYLKYGNAIEGIITLNLPMDQKKAALAKASFAVALFLSFPLQSVVAYQILWGKLSKRFPPGNSKRCIVDYTLRTCLTCLPVAVSIGAPALGAFMGLLGALCLSLLGIVFPAIMDLAVYYTDGYGPCKWRLWSDILIIIIGIFCLFSGVYSSVLEMIASYQ